MLTDTFALPETTPAVSVKTINIAGVLVYLCGVAELTPAQAQDVTVVFHSHGRTRSHKNALAVAFQAFSEIKDRKKGLVFVTMDNRNHGARAIDELSIQTWNKGNVHHGQDMMSMVDGIAADYKLVMNHLQAYVGSEFIITEFIATGTSLGGHVTWNLLAQDKRIQRGVIFVGCPNMTALLLDRVGEQKDTILWNKYLEQVCLDRDAEIAGITGKEIVILNGAEDTLVSDKFTKGWVEKYGKNNKVLYKVQEGRGHGLSFGMVEDFVKWLAEVVN
ncbi:Alpha/Beta hydrolase protein [Lipomyces arxii]|uniref:Alpha/Beta hydrolase protein n=1 Tax=Lipomyces arxii TaxID=56418 RepID=UPI0034CFCA94